MNRLALFKSVVGNIIIAAFFSLFVFINMRAFDATGNLMYLLVALNESIYVFLYLIRRRPVATSTSVSDWGIAFSGTFIGTLLRPANTFFAPAGGIIVGIGSLVNIASVISLNRSIGTVPARRHVKTHGAYRIVRHPMYASEIIVIFGYMIGNLSVANLIIVVANVALLLMRIDREERFLSTGHSYRNYVAHVRAKLLPFIY